MSETARQDRPTSSREGNRREAMLLEDVTGGARILLLGPSLTTSSGVSTHVRGILESALSKRHAIRHFQVGSQGRNENALQVAFRLLTSPFKLFSQARRHQADIVFINASMDVKSILRDMLYALASKLAGSKIIFQVHGGRMPRDFAGRHPLLGRVLRGILKRSDEIIVLGERIREDYELFSSGLRLNVIQNAIDLEPYAEMRGKELPGEGPIILFFIGRIVRNKGVFETVEALSRLKDESFFPRLRLDIAGGGPASSELEALVDSLGLGDSVRLLGPVFGSDKIELWRQAHVFVFPTHHNEALPYAIIESLAAAVPMVTTRRGAIEEMVEQGREALFVPERDSAAVAEALDTLLGSPDQYGSMSKLCKERAQAKYGMDRLECELERLINGIRER